MTNKTKDLTQADPPPGPGDNPPTEAPKPPRLTWKAVEPRHHAMAQTVAAEQGKEDYRTFVLSLLEAVDGVIMNDALRAELSKATVAAAVAEFEEKFKEVE
jgi:hypothetical protein